MSSSSAAVCCVCAATYSDGEWREQVCVRRVGFAGQISASAIAEFARDSSAHSFVLTSETNARLWGCAVSSGSHMLAVLSASETAVDLVAAVAESLLALAARCPSPADALLQLRNTAEFLVSLPEPAPGCSLYTQLHDSTPPQLLAYREGFASPRWSHPAVVSSLCLLCTLLPPAQLVTAVTALWMEQRVILACPAAYTAVRGPAARGLLSLLAPLSWQHTLVPVLPASACTADHLLALLEAPCPFLIGVDTELLAGVAVSHAAVLAGVVVVDLAARAAPTAAAAATAGSVTAAAAASASSGISRSTSSRGFFGSSSRSGSSKALGASNGNNGSSCALPPLPSPSFPSLPTKLHKRLLASLTAHTKGSCTPAAARAALEQARSSYAGMSSALHTLGAALALAEPLSAAVDGDAAMTDAATALPPPLCRYELLHRDEQPATTTAAAANTAAVVAAGVASSFLDAALALLEDYDDYFEELSAADSCADGEVAAAAAAYLGLRFDKSAAVKAHSWAEPFYSRLLGTQAFEAFLTARLRLSAWSDAEVLYYDAVIDARAEGNGSGSSGSSGSGSAYLAAGKEEERVELVAQYNYTPPPAAPAVAPAVAASTRFCTASAPAISFTQAYEAALASAEAGCMSPPPSTATASGSGSGPFSPSATAAAARGGAGGRASLALLSSPLAPGAAAAVAGINAAKLRNKRMSNMHQVLAAQGASAPQQQQQQAASSSASSNWFARLFVPTSASNSSSSSVRASASAPASTAASPVPQHAGKRNRTAAGMDDADEDVTVISTAADQYTTGKAKKPSKAGGRKQAAAPRCAITHELASPLVHAASTRKRRRLLATTIAAPAPGGDGIVQSGAAAAAAEEAEMVAAAEADAAAEAAAEAAAVAAVPRLRFEDFTGQTAATVTASDEFAPDAVMAAAAADADSGQPAQEEVTAEVAAIATASTDADAIEQQQQEQHQQEQPLPEAAPVTESVEELKQLLAASERERRRLALDLATARGCGGVAVMVRIRPPQPQQQLQQQQGSSRSADSAAESVAATALDDTTLQLLRPAAASATSAAAATATASVPVLHTFDRVFGSAATQADVYNQLEASVAAVVDRAESCSILAYGQTGSGKTHTMLGRSSGTSSQGDSGHGSHGVIPRALTTLFDALHTSYSGPATTDTTVGGTSYEVRMSMAEIYNDSLGDLLYSVIPHPVAPTPCTCGACNNNSSSTGGAAAAPVPVIRQTGTAGSPDSIVLQGMCAVSVASPADALRLLHLGSSARSVRHNGINAASSRSHVIVWLYVHTTTTSGAGTSSSSGVVVKSSRSAKLVLVDLAGSERLTDAHYATATATAAAGTATVAPKSGFAASLGLGSSWLGSAASSSSSSSSSAAAAAVAKSLQKESTAINSSLTALGKVIAALSDAKASSSSSSSSSSTAVHVPYRDSVLTLALSDCIGRHTRTILLATLSPAAADAPESLSTLAFATRAKKMRTAVTAAGYTSSTSNTGAAAALQKAEAAAAAAKAQAAAARAEAAAATARCADLTAEVQSLRTELASVRASSASSASSAAAMRDSLGSTGSSGRSRGSRGSRGSTISTASAVDGVEHDAGVDGMLSDAEAEAEAGAEVEVEAAADGDKTSSAAACATAAPTAGRSGVAVRAVKAKPVTATVAAVSRSRRAGAVHPAAVSVNKRQAAAAARLAAPRQQVRTAGASV